ncbi:MFS transporter [Halobacillus mangrovi]|uniref:MFS transporter n=1 Tax=Halobacillus mangrovi TaxID=402384 RepID=UPI003D955B32
MKNIRLLYVIEFLQSFVPAYVIERLFWEMRGMNVEMVVWTELIYAVTIISAEVPTGILADRIGRKPLIQLAAFFGCLEFAILIGATEFWHFGLAVFFAAIGTACSSGALYAFVYDKLMEEKKQIQFEKYVGYLQAFSTVTTIAVAFLGSWMATQYGLIKNYWISLMALSAAFILAMFLSEPERTKGQESAAAHMKASIQVLRSHPELWMSLLSGMILGAAFTFLDEFWQLYIRDAGMPVGSFGLFMALFFLIRLLGQLSAHFLTQRFNTQTLLLNVLAVFTLGFFGLTISPGWTGIALIFVVYLFDGLVEPVIAGYLHHRIGSEQRSTIESFWSLGGNVTLVIVGLGFGYVSGSFELLGGFGWISAICGGFFFIALWMYKVKE